MPPSEIKKGQGSAPAETAIEANQPDVVNAPGIRVGLRILRTGPAFILVALVIIMAGLNEYFLTVRNLQNLLTQTAMIAALALGQLLVIVVRGVDVSVGSALGLTVVLSGLLMQAGYENGLLHIAVFISAGALFGLFNGFMIVKGGIPQPLIVTVATLGIGRGMALLLSGGTEHIGMTPVVRLQPRSQFADWFVEAGVGANMILPMYRSADKRFSTEFNFGEHLGIGREFGMYNQHEIALRVQHFSNGGLKEPNPGENFLQVRYVSRF